MRTECSRASPRRDSAGWPEDRPGTEALARELAEVDRGVAVPEDLAAAQAEEAGLVEAPRVVPAEPAAVGAAEQVAAQEGPVEVEAVIDNDAIPSLQISFSASEAQLVA